MFSKEKGKVGKYLEKTKSFHWPTFILMASVTFMAILSELVPSGILPELMAGLNITEAQGGNLVGFYAISSAIFAIPLITLTVEVNRKRLLLLLLAGFSLSNFVVGLSTNYTMAIIGRVFGGICAGILCPMIAAYGMRITDDKHKGQAVAVIMSGTTFAMSVGLPIMTMIGTNFGWRMEFFVMAAIILLILVLSFFFLPTVSGEKRQSSNSPLTLIKNKGVLVVILLTIVAVVANYAVYTYITNLIGFLDYSKGIGMALILFGIGSILSVLLAGKIIDDRLRSLTRILFSSSILAFIIFRYLNSNEFIIHIAFILWGIGFGALVTLFQTAITRQVPENASAVATSLQSASFNLSIMIASSLGGYLLTAYSMKLLILLMAGLLIIGLILTFVYKRVLN